MQAEGTLELLAELAVAFAGFSGLVGVYRERSDPENDPRPDLRVLIEYSVYLLAAALVPLFLWHAGLSEPLVWRAASLFSALYTATYYSVRYRSLAESESKRPSAGPVRFTAVIFALDLLLAALLLVNASGVLPLDPIVLYLVALAYQLVCTALTFVRFVTPLWRAAA